SARHSGLDGALQQQLANEAASAMGDWRARRALELARRLAQIDQSQVPAVRRAEQREDTPAEASSVEAVDAALRRIDAMSKAVIKEVRLLLAVEDGTPIRLG